MYNTFVDGNVTAQQFSAMGDHSQSEFLDLEAGQRSNSGSSNRSDITTKGIHTPSTRNPTLGRASTQESQVTVGTIDSYISLPVKHPFEYPTPEDNGSQSSMNSRLESQPSATSETLLARSFRSPSSEEPTSVNTFIHRLDRSYQPTAAEIRFEFLVRLILITFGISMFMFGAVMGLVFYRTRR